MRLTSISSGVVRRVLRQFGLELRRLSSVPRAPARDTVPGLLRHARSLGFEPATVLDVGAAQGAFTEECHQVFPAARYVLFEPLAEHSAELRRKFGSADHVDVLPLALSARRGSALLHVHRDLFGSSLYLEREDSDVNGEPRTVRTDTLDHMCEERELKPPFLLKLDVQGAELDVLRGGQATLARTEYLILETSLFHVFTGAPVFDEVVAALKEWGFVIYDVADRLYRPLDEALIQLDVSFVKREGSFRRYHYYATRDQRMAQDQAFSALPVRR